MKLSDIRLVDAGARQHQALMRLTLKVMGETHRLLLPFQGWLTGLVRSSADDEGNANGAQLMQAMTTIEGRWSKVMADWVKLFEAARIQAASIPFGLLVVQHNAYLTGVKRPVVEAVDEEDTRPIVALWQQRRSRLLEVAQRKTYGDGMNLNQRIWRLENGGLTNIRNTLRTSMAERTNAFTLASLLEEQIGAEDKLPAWTAERLYSMTPRSRAKSEDGLLRGPDEKSKGVAYSALRLARTELQNANHAMSTEIARLAPWVTGRKVTLSAGHPKVDICDQWAAGGPYNKGEEILSLHPNCMCYYTDVLMDKSVFTQQIGEWLAGENDFLDDYSQWLGARDVITPLPWEMSVAESLELWLSTGQSGHAVALGL